MIGRALALSLYIGACGAALLGVTQVWAQTAIRPDQIGPKTPDLTWGPGGPGYQIGSTVPWRTSNATTLASTAFTTNDASTVVELTGTPTIAATLPQATGSFGDGFGFTIQVAGGTLTLGATTSTVGGSSTGITVGPYQAVSLLSRSGNWYAHVSAPVTAVVPPSGSVWSPTDLASPVTLSSTGQTNNTATVATGAAFKAVRGTVSYAMPSTNKKVFTLTLTAADAGWIGGVASSSVALTYPGGATPGYGVQAGASGADYFNGAAVGATPPTRCQDLKTWATGDVLWLAIDFSSGSGKVFCSANCTTWANAGNPSTGTGPVVTLPSGTYFPMWGGGAFTITDTAVINTTPNLGSCTGLSGFSGWG